MEAVNTTKPEIETIPTEPVKTIDNSSPMNVCDKKEEEQPQQQPPKEESKPDNSVQKEEKAPSEPQSTSTTTSKPESAATTTTTTTQTESELLAAGTKLIGEDKYEEAVPLLSNALEIIQSKNMATGIESVQYYMAYGEALLRFVQSSNDLFAAPVRESQQQHIEEQQEEDEEDAPPLITDATEQAEPAKEPEAEINGKEEQDEDEDDDLNQEQKQEPAPEQEKPVGGGDVDTSEDREIAWETFEYARTIIEDYLNSEENLNKNNDSDSYLRMLALCHSFLGELLIEDENNESALLEFEKALEIQNKCDNGYIKCRQRAFNHFMACLAAQFCEKDDDALKHCNVALQGLSERICDILKYYQCTEEFKEDNDYQQIVKVAEEFMNDKLNEEQKKEDQGKELKELIGVMGDLCAKLEEVEETIKLRKEQVGKSVDDGNHNKNVDLAEMDPFQALIMGLTDKFNIDQEALAGMEGMDDDDEVDENKNTSNGVTTIGFGDVKPVDDNEEINDLGSFGVKRKEKKEDINKAETKQVVEDKEVKKVNEIRDEKEIVNEEKKEKKIGKKRSMEDADIDGDDGMMNGVHAKKMRLNSGDAASVENDDGKN